jgi:2-oxoglutarate ferredoxin oxidoreductase subunit beta
MFNNGVYSLTKGQYSPLSLPGQITKSSPLGVLDDPFNPPALALGSGSSFVARAFDKDIKTMNMIIDRQAHHNGFSFTEVYANCVIYNDGAYDDYSKKGLREEHTVYLENGKPMVFGAEKDKGVKLDGFKPVVVKMQDGYSIDELLVHDETDSTLAAILADMTYNESVPRPAGILYAKERPSYEDKVKAQLEYYSTQPGAGDLVALMKGKESWVIE